MCFVSDRDPWEHAQVPISVLGSVFAGVFFTRVGAAILVQCDAKQLSNQDCQIEIEKAALTAPAWTIGVFLALLCGAAIYLFFDVAHSHTERSRKRDEIQREKLLASLSLQQMIQPPFQRPIEANSLHQLDGDSAAGDVAANKPKTSQPERTAWDEADSSTWNEVDSARDDMDHPDQ